MTKWSSSRSGLPLASFLALIRALDDENRVRALMALRGGELCLCQIIDLLGLAPSTVSKHMSLLLLAGLVKRRKRGRWHFFRLAEDSAPAAVRQVLAWVSENLAGDPVLAADAARLDEICARDLKELTACYRS